MDIDFKENIRQRHQELKSLGKVTEAVTMSGVSRMTYARAVNGKKYVRATTMMDILKAQAKVLELTKTKLQLV
ncbi:hypothetical protein [Dyadobacter bucti]|uniref:hypothetical protein n=1 Tax=Dyadobacter bucti TaxID=2572203 RepID=UPI0011084189|nr:hypothetical protein [Dyadobacter bucti]